ncbi:MAG: hypothetical protein IPL23_08155 [Saprospiraceae bacterium]|nr:hypothetical protein [Saprospiraceae bacterium]
MGNIGFGMGDLGKDLGGLIGELARVRHITFRSNITEYKTGRRTSSRR